MEPGTLRRWAGEETGLLLRRVGEVLMQKGREGPGGVASGGSRAPAEKVLDRRADVREDSVGLGRKNPTRRDGAALISQVHKSGMP